MGYALNIWKIFKYVILSHPELAFGELKRYETYRGSKATRGRVAIQNIPKRQ